jgi:hypothetical protein
MGIPFSNDLVGSVPNWDKALDHVEKCYTRLASFGLSVFGRARAAASYGMGKIYHLMEFCAPPPGAHATLLTSWTKCLIDRDLPPSVLASTRLRHSAGPRARPPLPPPSRPLQLGLPGLHSHHLHGRPADGGFGGIPWEQHIQARGVMQARRYLEWMLGDPASSLPPKPLLRLRHRMSYPTYRLTCEDQLMLRFAASPPLKPLWIDLASHILWSSSPGAHPALALLSAADPTSPGRVILPPGPLTRMQAALRSMGPLQPSGLPRPSPLPWAAALTTRSWLAARRLFGFGNSQELSSLVSQFTCCLGKEFLRLTGAPLAPATASHILPQAATAHTGPLLPSPPPAALLAAAAAAAAAAAIATAAAAPSSSSSPTSAPTSAPPLPPSLQRVPAMPRLMPLLPLFLHETKSCAQLFYSSLLWTQAPGKDELGRVSPLRLSDPTTSVRRITQWLLLPRTQARSQYRIEFIRDAMDPTSPIPPDDQPASTTAWLPHLASLHSSMRMMWKLPWPSTYKEAWWRLSVNGVAGAGGHDLCPNGPCPCGHNPGSQPPPSDPTGRRQHSYHRRRHVFWDCSPAVAIRDQLQLGLPGISIAREHVWLMRLPPGTEASLSPHVWSLVCSCAIHAMEQGRRFCWAAHLSPPPPPGSPVTSLDASACKHAISWFWSLLQEMTEGYSGTLSSAWTSLPPAHPFLSAVAGNLVLNLPLGLLTPPDGLPFSIPDSILGVLNPPLPPAAADFLPHDLSI